MRRALGLAALLAPATALACPACVRDLPPVALALVGGLIATPYLVALGVWRTVRRADDPDEPEPRR